MEKLKNESNISKKPSNDEEKIDHKNDKLNELKSISVKNEIEKKQNNKDEKNEKENEKRVSYNASENIEMNDTDPIYLEIKKKLSNDMSIEESEYLKLYYLFRDKCNKNNIKDYSLASLIENHAQNENKCKILHSCAKIININNLKKYKFKHCSSNDCPFKTNN